MPRPLRIPPRAVHRHVVHIVKKKSFFKNPDRIERSVNFAKIRSLSIEGEIQNLKNKLNALQKPIGNVIDGTLDSDDEVYDGPYQEGFHFPMEYGACTTPNYNLDIGSRRSTPIEPPINVKYAPNIVVEPTYGFRRQTVTDQDRCAYHDRIKMLRGLTHARDEMLRQFQLPRMPLQGMWDQPLSHVVENMKSELPGIQEEKNRSAYEKTIRTIESICEKWGKNEEKHFSDASVPGVQTLKDTYFRMCNDAPRAEYDLLWFCRQERQTYRTEQTKNGRKYKIEVSPNAPEAHNYSNVSFKKKYEKLRLPKIHEPQKKPWVKRMEIELAKPKIKAWKNPSKFDGLPQPLSTHAFAKLRAMKWKKPTCQEKDMPRK